jgi:glucokinase
VTEAIFASVDLGGTNIKAALGKADGTVLIADNTPTRSHEGPEGVLDRIAHMVNELAEKVGARPSALGMGVPGLVDLAQGRTLFLPNLPTQWRGVDVRALLSPRVDCPVYLLNDVRTATLGEMEYGHGREVASFIFFAIGTGIGGGIVIDHKLRLGPLGAAAEMGHQTIVPDGPICGCGNRGCMEALASGPAVAAAGVRLLRNGLAPILHDIVEGDLNRVTPETMAQAAREGEETVQVEVRRAAEFIGIGVANMVTALHPERVVFGGGVAQMGDLLLDPIREVLRLRVRMFPADTVSVVVSQLGDRAGTLGGIALALRKLEE